MKHADGSDVFVATAPQRAARRPLTLAEAAALLELDSSTLRRQISRGALRARKVGPIWTVTLAEVDRYRADHRGKPGRRRESR